MTDLVDRFLTPPEPPEHDALPEGYWAAILEDPEYIAAPLAPDGDLLRMLIDWPTFWKRENASADWMCEPIIARGRAHAMFAAGGTGKSLFSLWLAATIATGRIGLQGWPIESCTVLYLDYEMTEDDLYERLDAMGFGPTIDLSRLHYAVLPSLPPADAPEGGKAIAKLAELVNADLVVIDTFARAVAGNENDADTVRSFYRWTGIHLKAAGRAFLRMDHAGKDAEKGQRGSSAKNDDVDVVWQMTVADGGFKLAARKRRMGWVPETIGLVQLDDPVLRYRVAVELAPAGTDRVIADLDDLNVPVDMSARKAVTALKEAGRGARDQLVRAAQKQRSRRAFEPEKSRDAPRDAPQKHDTGRTPGRDDLNINTDQGGTHFGTRWDAVSDASGTRSVPLGTDAPSVAPEPDNPPQQPDRW